MLRNSISALVLALTVAACASTAPHSLSQSASALAAQRPPPLCLHETGTRLRLAPQDCAASGQSFTREDLQRSGGIDTAQQLQLLTPTLRIGGN
jgi:hypothetical protein